MALEKARQGELKVGDRNGQYFAEISRRSWPPSDLRRHVSMSAMLAKNGIRIALRNSSRLQDCYDDLCT